MYDDDGTYTCREKRGAKWLGYLGAFAGGVVIGALLFGRGCLCAPEEEKPPETAASAETAVAEVPAEPPTASTAAPAEEETIVFETPEEVPPPRVTPARPPTEPKPPTKPPEVTPRPAGKGLSPSQINQTIRKRLGGIQNEYNALLKNNPHLGGGKITVRFTISARGTVTSAAVVGDTIGNPELSAGIVRRVRSWKFQPSQGESTVIYPFVFVSSGM